MGVKFSILDLVWSFIFSIHPSKFVYQIEFASNGVLASDLSPALLLDMKELKRLQGRTEQIQVEIKDHKALHRRASREHIKLIKDQKDLDSKIQGKIHLLIEFHLCTFMTCVKIGWCLGKFMQKYINCKK